jgi:hypothetical protein
LDHALRPGSTGRRTDSGWERHSRGLDTASDIEQVRAYFRNFGERQAPENGSPLYEVLCLAVLADSEMLELAARCPPTQPSANLLLGAVHALLLAGARHPLRAFYPDVVAGEMEPSAPTEETYALFREFVHEHRDFVVEVLETRRVQTNVVRRTTCLLPLFASVAKEGGGRPLSLIEVGASAGLNLHWDRYLHRYELPSGAVLEWGDAASPVRLATRVRGPAPLPVIPPQLGVAWRTGIDLSPVDIADAEAMLWLRALIFPEHLERHHTIEAAARVALEHPVRLVAGDAVERLPALMRGAPDDTSLCLYASMVLNQLPRDSRAELWERIADLSRSRPVWFISMEGTAEGWTHLRILDFAEGRRADRHLADAHAHGRWLEWLGGATPPARPVAAPVA